MGATGAEGAPGVPQYASVTSQQNPDGSTSTTYAGGPALEGKRYYAFTDTNAPDGTLLTQELDRNSGGHLLGIETSGQTVTSSYYDTFVVDVADGAAGNNTFVFDPGFAVDTVHYFSATGRNHDTLSLASSDFNNIAAVLRDTQDGPHGLTITDPTSHDQIRLLGVTKAQLAANPKDIAFHG